VGTRRTPAPPSRAVTAVGVGLTWLLSPSPVQRALHRPRAPARLWLCRTAGAGTTAFCRARAFTPEPARRLSGRPLGAVAAQRGRRLSLPGPRRRWGAHPSRPKDGRRRRHAVLGGGARPLPGQLRGSGGRGARPGRCGVRGALSGGSRELRGWGTVGVHRRPAPRGRTLPPARADARAEAAPPFARHGRRRAVAQENPAGEGRAVLRRRAALRRPAARVLHVAPAPGPGRGSSARRRGSPPGRAPGREPTSRCPHPRRTTGRR
jgi:hypothetical protein